MTPSSPDVPVVRVPSPRSDERGPRRRRALAALALAAIAAGAVNSCAKNDQWTAQECADRALEALSPPADIGTNPEANQRWQDQTKALAEELDAHGCTDAIGREGK